MIDALLWLLKLYVKGGIGIVTVALFVYELVYDHPVVRLLRSLSPA